MGLLDRDSSNMADRTIKLWQMSQSLIGRKNGAEEGGQIENNGRVVSDSPQTIANRIADSSGVVLQQAEIMDGVSREITEVDGDRE